jgi:hypothetical protein
MNDPPASTRFMIDPLSLRNSRWLMTVDVLKVQHAVLRRGRGAMKGSRRGCVHGANVPVTNCDYDNLRNSFSTSSTEYPAIADLRGFSRHEESPEASILKPT